MLENFMVLLLLAPLMIGTWWGLIRLVNRSMGFNLKDIYRRIYDDPIAAAILRVGIVFSVAYLVEGAFSRYV